MTEAVANVASLAGREDTTESESEVERLRRENAELKNLVKKGLWEKLDLKDLSAAIFLFDEDEMACIRLCKSPTRSQWRELPLHLKLNAEVMEYAICNCRSMSWEDVPVQFKDFSVASNVDLLARALDYRKIKLQDIPEHLQQSNPVIALWAVMEGEFEADDCPCLRDQEDLFREAIEKLSSHDSWRLLPTALKTNAEFALSLSKKCRKRLARYLLHDVVELRSNRSFWLELPVLTLYHRDREMTVEANREVSDLLGEFCSVELRQDRIFLLQILEKCPMAIQHADPSLTGDRSFLKEAMEANCNSMLNLSYALQEQYQDLVVSSLPRLLQQNNYDPYTCVCIPHKISPNLWAQRDFCLAWFHAGLGLEHTVEINAVAREQYMKDFDLLAACIIQTKSFWNCSDDFHNDPDFVVRVLEHHPDLYRHIRVAATKENPKVMIAAFSGSLQVTKEVMELLYIQGNNDEINKCCSFLRSQLEPFENLMLVIGNMLSTQSVEDTGTPLTLLNQGPETSLAYKKRLAEYLGVPAGKWLCQLQQAEKNVLEVMSSWSKVEH